MSDSTINIGTASEFGVRPSAFVMYSPENVDWSTVTPDKLEEYGLIGEVSTEGFRRQYKDLSDTLVSEGMRLLPLVDLISTEELEAIDEKLNLMFTRDPATTIPWAPDLFIPSSMSIVKRRSEVSGMAKALMNLGMQPATSLDSTNEEYGEGGDLYPIVIDGDRTLLIGVGMRTREKTAKILAAQLMPEIFDQILLLQHDEGILHLDTGFTPLPNNTLFVAENMFIRGLLMNRTNPSGEEIADPLQYFKDRHYKVVTTTKRQAVENEIVNMVPIGNDTFVGFPLGEALKQELEDKSGARFVEVAGDQIAPAQGGAHCLTRPVFIDL